MNNMGPAIYITKALTKAKFKEMKPCEFKRRYLEPVDKIITAKKIDCDLLSRYYDYPKGNPYDCEQYIQSYFNNKRSDPLQKLFKKIYDDHSEFGALPLFRPPFFTLKLIKPDITHLYNYSDSMDFRIPEACIALGDFKKGTYKMAEGFNEFRLAIKEYRKILADHRILKPQVPTPVFNLGPWSEKAAFALVLRKYLLDTFLCGTDRVYISDHQNFSGFFQYDIMDDDQMIINYYVINDPETVAHGITLRSAEAGFFYKDIREITATRERLSHLCKESKRIPDRIDPFEEKRPTKRGISDLFTIEENAEGKEQKVFEGNTTCRVIHEAPKCYPSLGIDLPQQVFVKLYHYSGHSWEIHELIYLNAPSRREYYHMFFNELEINKIIASSQYASHFPKLFASGYWNGLQERPIHIFEYLGEELPEENWDKDKVYKVIKSRVKELHSLGITHNDIRIPNIHVSVSGKISLIDFGLSDANNNESRKKRDLEFLDQIFEISREIDGKKCVRNKSHEENRPRFLHQNEIKNIENLEHEPNVYYHNTDENKMNYENDPASVHQNQDLFDRNDENYEYSPLTFHDIDPFFGKGPQ